MGYNCDNYSEDHTSCECQIVKALVDYFNKLTLKVLIMTIDAQWEGMGDEGLARYEPALLPPCPRVLSYSN